MLTALKIQKLQQSLKTYKKQFLDKPIDELDESGTRLLINHFLTEVLGFKTLEEIKTEYMIRGTYADYVIQIGGKQHFLVEVKAISLNLSDKHLRQSINYGANEGIDWVLLTNGKIFNLYKVIFEKPISNELVFSIDLSDSDKIKDNTLKVQYLHRDSVSKKGLDELWDRYSALSPKNISRLIYSKEIIRFLQKQLKKRYGIKFEEEQIEESVLKMATESIVVEEFKSITRKKRKPNSNDTTESKADKEDFSNGGKAEENNVN